MRGVEPDLAKKVPDPGPGPVSSSQLTQINSPVRKFRTNTSLLALRSWLSWTPATKCSAPMVVVQTIDSPSGVASPTDVECGIIPGGPTVTCQLPPISCPVELKLTGAVRTAEAFAVRIIETRATRMPKNCWIVL